jgi:hypothetical protein
VLLPLIYQKLLTSFEVQVVLLLNLLLLLLLMLERLLLI